MKNKTRKLNDRVSYKVGKNFCNIIVNGKRYNFTLDEVRGQEPSISEKALYLYDMCVHDSDKAYFCFGDYGESVRRECERYYIWECITPKTVEIFLRSRGLI